MPLLKYIIIIISNFPFICSSFSRSSFLERVRTFREWSSCESVSEVQTQGSRIKESVVQSSMSWFGMRRDCDAFWDEYSKD